MTVYTKVSRRNLNEDRIAICPQMGCGTIKRVKPLKLGFIGFGKYPKCKKHNLPLVYVDERIGEVVTASIACLFDKSGLPAKSLLKIIEEKFPKEYNSFIDCWIYCITIGRGAQVISNYMDSLANAYLKSITKKQLEAIKSQKNNVFKAIKNGINEITKQFERLLKHLRVHSEVFVKNIKIQSPSTGLSNLLTSWLEKSTEEIKDLIKIKERKKISLLEIKQYYDVMLNSGICRCLLGLESIEKRINKQRLSAFDRFNAYYEFWEENLTEKFRKADIDGLYKNLNINVVSANNFTREELAFFEKNNIDISKLKTRWLWVKNKKIS